MNEQATATAQQATTQTQPSKSIVIGVAWNREKKDGTGRFLRVSFLGKKEDDQYEVVLRRRDDGAELPLSEASCVMFDNSRKTDSEDDAKKPDRILRAYVETE